MSIICGFLKNKDCDACSKKCSNYTPVYTGDDYAKEVLKTIANIYSEYSLDNIMHEIGIKYILVNLRSIRSIRDILKIRRLTVNYNSLSYMMGIYGHYSQFANDHDDIFYVAANIVLIQQHLFKQCSIWDRYEAYKTMYRIGIKLDNKMKADCKTVVKRYHKK